VSVDRLLLFDIDNTLLYSGGAGSFAMNVVFRELFGIDDGFGKIEFSGRTDRFIVQSALDAHGVTGHYDDHIGRFLEGYYGLLPQTLVEKQGSLMPGFPELLTALNATDGVRLGLATGNFSQAARHKLAHYGIEHYFTHNGGLLGGFGEESAKRADTVKTAISCLDGDMPDHVLVIGDTPKDVEAALDCGVIAVGVATGSYSTAQLEECGAQMVFEDFSDWETAAKLLTTGTA
jgi:phosphoglycolate phosphatase-like HAD superfamily hydrolase